ncbi:methylated-DNA--[protein]-cysteine S-methyltransferase [Roseivirga sp. BDSF3-8]|uniref:methylated-DNA--[protein]-cysteine S-methyltransferase n=1 Tax=Roseivirga sp. BDSF3-8 TaxID=3241598 RepID=UPI00353206D0
MCKNIKFVTLQSTDIQTYLIASPVGALSVTGNEEALTAIRSVEHDAAVDEEKTLPQWVTALKNQLVDYFAAKRTCFDLAVAPAGTPFQQKVWKELARIPYGKTCSYLELSQRLGDVKAIRAVGRANGKNPLWIIVPCHRVIGADGSLTGYAGGIKMKKFLLDLEARHSGTYQMDLNF